MDVATRGRGSHRNRLALGVASGLAIALSLSGLALANERPTVPGSKPPAHKRGAIKTRPLPVSVTADNLAPHTFALLHKRSRQKKIKQPPPYTLPVARRLITRAQLHRPHHDYPAWDLGVPVGTRVVAVRAGVVEDVTNSGSCGNGVIVVGTDGYTYTYCHGSKVVAHPGDEVETGQRLMFSGDSGNSTGPHLHLQIASPSGRLLCPQSLVTSWFKGGHASPRTATPKGCFYLTGGHHKHRRHHHHRRHRSRSGDNKKGHRKQPKPGPTPTPTPSLTPSPSASPTPTPSPSASPTPTPVPSPTLT